jgi:hypothetical protein
LTLRNSRTKAANRITPERKTGWTKGIANAGVLGRGGSRIGDQLRRHADLQTDGDCDINTAGDLKGRSSGWRKLEEFVQ